MKGKCKKILSLVLALAIVVQLFAGLGEVVKAANATQVTITGLGGHSASALDGKQEQIGFKMSGATIADTDQWQRATILGEGFLLNNSKQTASDGWYIDTTGSGSFALTKEDYIPTAGDTITLSQGMQFQLNAGSKSIYEIEEAYIIKFDGYIWGVEVENTTPITIKQLGGGHKDYTSATKQIGFDINEAVTVGKADWVTNYYATYRSILLNDKAQSTWYIYSTKQSDFVLVCPAYTPVEGDIIKFLAGTQFTCEGVVYEITEDFAIKWDGTTWTKYVVSEEVKGIPIIITGLGGHSASALDGKQEQIGFKMSGATIADTDQWIRATILGEGFLLNSSKQTASDGWYIDTTGADSFALTKVDYKPTAGDTITLSKGMQIQLNEGSKSIYEIEEAYIIKFDGYIWGVEVENTTPITIKQLGGGHKDYTSATKQIGFDINEAVTVGKADWVTNYYATYRSILLNDKAQSTWYIYSTKQSDFVLVCPAYTPVEGDVIKFLAGTQFTCEEVVYEFGADYTVYYYDGAFFDVPKPEATTVTITGINTDRTRHSSVWELHMYTNPAITMTGEWKFDDAVSVTLNGNPDGNAHACWTDTGFYLQPDIGANDTLESLTIKAGTEFTISSVLYEIANDFTIYHKNGLFSTSPLYDITKTVDGVTTTETVSGDYTLPEASKEGYITLGWDVDGALYKVGEVLPAKLEGYTIKAVNVAFSQLDGAQVRLSAPSDKKIGGIRFVCRLGSDSLSTHIVEMGMLVMPTNYMTNGEFTHKNYESQVNRYREFVVAKDDMELEVYEQDKTANGAQYYYLKGSIVNLYDYNYTRSYSARSFLKVQYHDGVDYLYTDYNEDNNERRICDVAKKMIETYPEDYSPAKNTTYPIVYEYAKVADTMESFAFFGPQVVVTNDAYDVEATKKAMQNYADAGFKYLLMEGDGYHVDNTFGTTTLEEEQQVYDNPRLPKHNLKQTMHLAKECGLEVIVLDWSLVRLSESDIALVSDNPTEVLAMCLQTTDGQYPTLIGSTINESLFDEANKTYTYNGQTATVLHYVKQFASYDELKEWVAIKMSAYAKELNFRGVRLDDEPTTSQYDAVAMMTKVIKELYPKAYVQSSNLQSYSKVYSSNYDKWSNAWNTLLDKNTEATEVGINFYPFRKNSDFWSNLSSEGYELQSNYLRTLQELATTTQNEGLDLELTIQSYATESHYHTVSANRLALQTHLALAFGTKTLGYFRYTGKDTIEPEANSTITQTIDADSTLKNAVLYANKNGNYLKAHMTFFDYTKSKVFGSGSYVSTSGLIQKELTKNIITVPNEATVLVNEFYNEHTSQYGYYVVNLAQLHYTSLGYDVTNDDITITLSEDCLVYKDYNSYETEETSRVKSVTLSDGQGAFIVVED